jgi:hypothetical protein
MALSYPIRVGRPATPLRICKLPLESPVRRPPFTLENSAAPDMANLDADLTVLS